MAGRKKEPVDLLIAKGKKHLTKEEIERRRAEEKKLEVPFTDIDIPDCLKDYPEVASEFEKYAHMLSRIGNGRLFTELDVDCLTRYVLSHALYLRYTGLLLDAKNADSVKLYMQMQSKAFSQAHQSASVMGLNITSRCRLVVPVADGDDDGDEEIDNV